MDANAQESSSQTSSADNGDPQTPSPLYTEALASHVDVARVTESDGFEAKAVDPHFARLLNALTSSAKANGSDAGKINNTLPPSVPLATGEILTLHGSSQARPMPASFNIAEDSATAHLRPSSKPSKQLASVAVPSDDSSRLNDSSQGTHMSSPSLASLSTAMSGLSTSQSPSAKSAHSRGPSMITADLSPYLARPAGIPINGKRLKQLALLEAVADQSSRMTPAPAMHPSTQLQLSPQVPPPPVHAPLPPNPAMPHNFTNLSSMYSNTHGPYLHPVSQTGHFNPPTPDNAFIVRPRTSNSFCPPPSHPQRTFNSRGSMNQAQLLNALSGTPYTSSSGFHRPSIPPMLNVPGPSAYPFPPSVMTGMPSRSGSYPPAVGRGPPAPSRAQPSRSASGPVPAQNLPFTPAVPFPHSIVSPQNSHLLSILNRGSGQ